jgi:hypothetical protein
LEDIQDRKEDRREGYTTVNQRPSSHTEKYVSAGELYSRLSRIAIDKEAKVKKLRHLETALNRLIGSQDPNSRFFRSLVVDRRGPLSKSGKERETVRREIHRVREQIKQLEESEQGLLAEQKKLSG